MSEPTAVSGRLTGFSVVGRAIGRAEPRSNLTLEFATDRNETVVVENDDQPMPAGSDETPHLGGVHRDVSANLNEAESGKPLENAHERTADLEGAIVGRDHRTILDPLRDDDLGPGDHLGGRTPAQRDAFGIENATTIGRDALRARARYCFRGLTHARFA